MLSLTHKALLFLSMCYSVNTTAIAASIESFEKDGQQQAIVSSSVPLGSSQVQNEALKNTQDQSEIPSDFSNDNSSVTQIISLNSSLPPLNESSSSNNSTESFGQNSTQQSNPFPAMLEKAQIYKKNINRLKRKIFSLHRIENLVPELLKTPLLWSHKMPLNVLERIRRFSIATQNPEAAALLAIYSNQFFNQGNFRTKGQVLKSILKKASKNSESINESVLYQVCLATLDASLYHRSSKSWKKYKHIIDTIETLITRVIREHKETMNQDIASFLQKELAHFVGCQPHFYKQDDEHLIAGLRYLSMYSGKGDGNAMFSLGIHCMNKNVPLEALTGWNRKIKTLSDRIHWGLQFLKISLEITPYASRFNLAKEKAIDFIGLQRAHQLFGRQRSILSLELDYAQEDQSQS